MGVNFEITVDRFDESNALIDAGLSNAIRALGFAVQARASDNVEKVDAIDTGALRASIFTDTNGSKTRDQAVAAAIAAGKNPGVHSGKPQLETVIAAEGEQVEGPFEAKVGVCVNYGIYVEMGVNNAFGRNIRIPARPYLLPAAEEVRGEAAEVTKRFIQDELAK